MREVYIDGLRGVAATAVMLYHFSDRVSQGGLLQWGYLGVAVFFVLSGYVISMSVGAKPISAGFLGRFALRRCIRLDPPYWASIAAAIVLAIIGSYLGFAKELPSFERVAAHMFYLQDILAYDPILAVYWTLCLEIQFYMFLVVLLWIFQQRLTSPAFLVAFAAMFAYSLAAQTIGGITPRGLMIPYWFCFALGALTYWVKAGRIPKLYLYVAAAVTFCLMFARHGDWLAVAALTAMSIHVCNGRRWLSGATVQFLGRISYSLYMYHAMVGWTAMSVALMFVPALPAALVGIVASIVASWLSYRLIEVPSTALSRKVLMAPESLTPERLVATRPPAPYDTPQ